MAAVLATNPWPNAEAVIVVDLAAYSSGGIPTGGRCGHRRTSRPTHPQRRGRAHLGRFPVFDQYNLAAEPPALEVYAIDTYSLSATDHTPWTLAARPSTPTPTRWAGRMDLPDV